MRERGSILAVKRSVRHRTADRDTSSSLDCVDEGTIDDNWSASVRGSDAPVQLGFTARWAMIYTPLHRFLLCSSDLAKAVHSCAACLARVTSADGVSNADQSP